MRDSEEVHIPKILEEAQLNIATAINENNDATVDFIHKSESLKRKYISGNIDKLDYGLYFTRLETLEYNVQHGNINCDREKMLGALSKCREAFEIIEEEYPFLRE